MVHVDVDCERLLVYTDTWSPDWRVYIDGQLRAALRVNGAARGLMVPAGAHDVEWVYAPRRLAPLLLVMVASVLASGFLLCVPLVRIPDRTGRAERRALRTAACDDDCARTG